MIPRPWAAVPLWVQFLSSLALLAVAWGAPQHQEACLGVLKEADAVPKESRSYEVYRQCHLQRPSGGFVTDGNEKEDCAQFSRLYRMAAHYGEPKPDEFCSMVSQMRSGDVTSDPRVAEHRVCVASLPKILQYPNVTMATKAACLALRPKLLQIEVACSRYALEVGNAVSLGLLDEHRLCDRVITGGFTSGFDQDHFVYSCEQYAANLAKRREDGEGPRELGMEAKKNCESHVPPVDKPFCMEYTRLALQSEGDVNRTKFAEICEMQYYKMMNPNYGAPKNESLPEAESVAVKSPAKNESEPPTIIAEPEPLSENGSDTSPVAAANETPPNASPGETPPVVESRVKNVESATSKEAPHGAYVGAGATDKQVRILLGHKNKHRRINKVSEQALDELVKAKAVTTRRNSKHRRPVSSPSPAQQGHAHRAKKSGYMKYLSAWTQPDEGKHKVQALVSETSSVSTSDSSEMQDQDASDVDSDEGAEAGILKGFLAQDGSLAGANAEKAVTRAAISEGDDPSEAVEEADESPKSIMGSSGDMPSTASADEDDSVPASKTASDESNDSSLLSEASTDTSESGEPSTPTLPTAIVAESKDDSDGVDDMVQSFLKSNS